jgi:hypothetical protein
MFACGLVIALANRLSAGLPSSFILLSSGIMLQSFLNIPLTTNLLSSGAAILFLLWYLTPRTIFATTDRDMAFATGVGKALTAATET